MTFENSGIYHLRYFDIDENILDTTILVDKQPVIEDQVFRTVPGEHSVEILVNFEHFDSQEFTCNAVTDIGTFNMELVNEVARKIISGNPGDVVNSIVNCNDTYYNLSTTQDQFVIPNVVPIIRNIPDISLEPGETRSIDVTRFGFDIENDALTYSIFSQSNPEFAVAAINESNISGNSSNLTIIASNIGISNVCIIASDTENSDPNCFNIFVESGDESKLKNNEFTNTNIDVLMKIQYWNGTNWEDEFTDSAQIPVQPGADNQIDLSNIFSWDTSTSSQPEGLFRVYFKGIDEFGNTLINRDGSSINDTYNFSIILFNSPPVLEGIPDQIFFENETNLTNVIDLFQFTTENEQELSSLTYEIVSQTNPSLVNCFIDNGQFISCNTTGNLTGNSTINVSVNDTFSVDYDEFNIQIIEFQEFMRNESNLTYSYFSPDFNVSGNESDPIRIVDVGSVQPGTYTILAVISDGVTNTTRNITVNVFPDTNITLEQVDNKTIFENQTLNFTLNATTGSNLTLTYGTNAGEILLGPNSLNNTTGEFIYTPTFNESGFYNVTFNATDGFSVAEINVFITVINVNRAPVLDPVGDKNVSENETLSFFVNGSDPDGDNVTIIVIDLPPGASFNSSFNWTPDFNQSGSYNVTFEISDGSLTDNETITITVFNTNRPPVLDFIDNKTVNETDNLTFFVSGSDPDNDTLTFGTDASATLPGAAIFNENTGEFSYVPNFDAQGSYNVTFNVTDSNGGSDSQIVLITVLNVNRPPVLDNIGNKTVNETENLVFNVSGSDPDDDLLSLFALNLPNGSNFTNGTFNWTPSEGDIGNYTVVFVITDGNLSDNESVVITVLENNNPPILDPIGDKNISENETLTILLNGFDPDNNTLLFGTDASFVLPSLFSFDANTGVFIWTPTFDDAGSYNVTFNVTDGEFSDEEQITIIVNDVNRAPSLDSIGNKIITTGDELSFFVNGSDPDNDTLNYSIIGLPNGATFAGQIFNWTPLFNQSGNYTVTFIVSDGNLSDNETILIVVTQNRPPVFDPIGTQFVLLGDTLVFDLNASDPDNDTLTFGTKANMELFTDPDFDPLTGIFNWTPTPLDDGMYNVTFNVTDGFFDVKLILEIQVSPRNLTIFAIRDTFIKEEFVNENEGNNPSLLMSGDGKNQILMHFKYENIRYDLVKSAKISVNVVPGGNNWQGSDEINLGVMVDHWRGGNASHFNTTPADSGNGTGATWNCGIDENITNNLSDCDPKWNITSTPSLSNGFILTDSDSMLEWNVAGDLEPGHPNGWILNFEDNESNLTEYLELWSVEGAAMEGNLFLAPTLQISYDNSAPINTLATNLFTGRVGSKININLNSYDPDEYPLTYGTNADAIIGGANYNFDTSTGVFEWIPTNQDIGTYEIMFTVSDDMSTIQIPVTITVKRKLVFGSSPIFAKDPIKQQGFDFG